jgi:hypothetical protein
MSLVTYKSSWLWLSKIQCVDLATQGNFDAVNFLQICNASAGYLLDDSLFIEPTLSLIVTLSNEVIS